MPASLPFDIAIIGAGIQGAGVAQAAAAAGYTVALIEKGQPGDGTSSKSSKLIHGGLRYLQQGEIGLVRESLRERQILLRIAPHLVRLNDFYIPVYSDSSYSGWQLRLGLVLYTLLSGYRQRFSTVPRAQWQQLDGLVTRNLRQVFRYRDGQTDDRLLTAAVARSASELGATLLTGTTLLHATREPGEWQLALDGPQQQTLTCRVLVNAAGPWANRVAKRLSPAPDTPEVELVQGSHLVLGKCLSDHCYYLESPRDRRAIFALPWHGKTLLGTTERLFDGDPDNVAPSQGEISYLLETLAHYFPGYSYDDDLVIEETMAGLRVLPKTPDSPFRRSREVNLVQSPGYIAIYGGKLTGYRATAQRVIRALRRELGSRSKRADTATLKLPVV